jgi:hypothetical protein
VPAAAGSNCTVKVNVLLGLTLTGNWLWPVSENDDPLTLALEMVTGAEPWFITVMFVLAIWPIDTEPKVTVELDTTSVPVVAWVEDFPRLEIFEVHPHNAKLPMSKRMKAGFWR